MAQWITLSSVTGQRTDSDNYDTQEVAYTTRVRTWLTRVVNEDVAKQERPTTLGIHFEAIWSACRSASALIVLRPTLLLLHLQQWKIGRSDTLR